MKSINFKRLAVYILVASIVPGIMNAVVSPEPTPILNVAYGLYMGCVLGTIFYFLERRAKK